MDLTTTYMGLKLRNPLVISASPISADIDQVKRAEELGASAIVMYSLFEEQMNRVLEDMKKQIAKENNAIKKLEKFAYNHLKLMELNKNMAEIIQVELRQSTKFMKEYKNEKFHQYLNIIGDIIQEGQEKGIFKEDINSCT